MDRSPRSRKNIIYDRIHKAGIYSVLCLCAFSIVVVPALQWYDYFTVFKPQKLALKAQKEREEQLLEAGFIEIDQAKV